MKFYGSYSFDKDLTNCAVKHIEFDLEMVDVLPVIPTYTETPSSLPFNKNPTPFEYEILLNKKTVCELEIRGAERPLINRFRRSIMRNVKALAIEDVDIEINSSVICDESIAHRLALLPLTFSGTVTTDTSIPFTLKAVGDLPYKKKITSKDIVFEGDVEVTGVSPIILQYLHPGEEISLKGFVKTGRGREHSKWCPVSGVQIVKLRPRIFRFRFENNGQIPNNLLLREALSEMLQESLN